MKNLWLVYLYVIYLSSILKNTDEYLRNTLILSYSFLVIYEYKYIVDAFFWTADAHKHNGVVLCNWPVDGNTNGKQIRNKSIFITGKM